jgi:hypothetical protein
MENTYTYLSVYRNSEELLLPYLSDRILHCLSMCIMSLMAEAVTDLHWTTSHYASTVCISLVSVDPRLPIKKSRRIDQALETSSPRLRKNRKTASKISISSHLPRADLQEHYPIEAMNDTLTFEHVFTNTRNPAMALATAF